MNYDKAYSELKTILSRLQNEEVGLEKLSADITKASELLEFCKTRLRSIESDVEKLIEKQ
jgi:exodeoxyribonuclease VII small subunit